MKKSIPASSSHWDGKQITLTETTKRNIRKKAITIDAETMTGLPEDQALPLLIARGITEDKLAETEGSYLNNANKAIELLEANKSAGGRVQAIQTLQQLGYTNIYEANTEDFITPPESAQREEPSASPPAEANEPSWKSNPYFNRGAKQERAVSTAKQVAWDTAQRIREQNARVSQMQEAESQMYRQEKEASKSQFIQSMVPRVAGAVKRNEVSNFKPAQQMGSPVRMPQRAPIRSPTVTPYVNRQMQQAQPTQQPTQQAMFDPNKEAVKKYGLNPGIAAKFNMARRNVVQPRLPPDAPPKGGTLLTGRQKINPLGKFSFRPRSRG
jgi:hypothetical protein